MVRGKKLGAKKKSSWVDEVAGGTRISQGGKKTGTRGRGERLPPFYFEK